MERADARDSKRQMAKCGVAWRVSVTFVRNANDSTSGETRIVTDSKLQIPVGKDREAKCRCQMAKAE